MRFPGISVVAVHLGSAMSWLVSWPSFRTVLLVGTSDSTRGLRKGQVPYRYPTRIIPAPACMMDLRICSSCDPPTSSVIFQRAFCILPTSICKPYRHIWGDSTHSADFVSKKRTHQITHPLSRALLPHTIRVCTYGTSVFAPTGATHARLFFAPNHIVVDRFRLHGILESAHLTSCLTRVTPKPRAQEGGGGGEGYR
jgi:hypothetical protein